MISFLFQLTTLTKPEISPTNCASAVLTSPFASNIFEHASLAVVRWGKRKKDV